MIANQGRATRRLYINLTNIKARFISYEDIRQLIASDKLQDSKALSCFAWYASQLK